MNKSHSRILGVILLFLIAVLGLLLNTRISHPSQRPQTSELPAPPVSLAEPESQNQGAPEEPTIEAVRFAFQTGDYEGALKLAKDSLRNKEVSSQAKEWIKSQMPQILISLAWLRLKEKRCSEAIDLLQTSLGLKAYTSAYQGLAYCYQAEGLTQQAEETIDQYFANTDITPYPIDSFFVPVILDVLESARNFPKALEILDKQQAALSPGTPEMEALAKWKVVMSNKSRESTQQEVIHSQFFQVTYLGERHSEIGQTILKILDQALGDLRNVLPVREPRKTIEVIIHNKKQFSQVTPSPHWAGAIFDGRIRIPISSQFTSLSPEMHQSLSKTIKHELIHALLFQMAGDRSLPPWFEEGLAQISQCLSSQSQSCPPFSYPPLSQSFLSAPHFQSSFMSMDEFEAKKLYQQSLFLIYVLLQKTEGRGLADILSQLSPTSSLTSDDLIQEVAEFRETPFQEFVAMAGELWKQRANFSF